MWQKCSRSQLRRPARYETLPVQVSPLKWSADRNRGVLARALSGAVSDDAIREAAAAIEEGFQGTLARCDSQRPQPWGLTRLA